MDRAIPTPAEAAAANRRKREEQHSLEASQKLGQLVALCLAQIPEYSGDECISFELDKDLTPYVSKLNLPGWDAYLSLDGKLYLGEAIQVGMIRTRDSLVPPTPAEPATVTESTAASVTTFDTNSNTGTAVEATPDSSLAQVSDQAEIATTARVTAAGESKVIAVESALVTVRAPAKAAIAAQATVDETVQISELIKARPVVALKPAQIERRTFKLLELEPQVNLLPTTGAEQAFAKVLQTEVEACSVGGEKLVQGLGFHGLIETVHMAFSKHFGLELAPDDIWLTVAHSFARLVNQEPELFRNNFVSHSGKKKLSVRRDEFLLGSSGNDWMSVFSEFSDKIAENIGAANHALLVSDFTTTGPIERAASEVVMMDTLQAYFNYSLDTLCGIPFVTLLGSTDDWERAAQKVRSLAQFGDLAWWLEKLYPIMDQFVAASKGSVDLDFWNRMYKKKTESGGVCITGWITHLLPVLNDDGKPFRNPLLTEPYPEPHIVTPRSRPYGDSDVKLDPWRQPCINTSCLPASLSTVPFVWNYKGTELDYQFIGGIVGYSQNATDGSLRPRMGWAVRPAPDHK